MTLLDHQEYYVSRAEIARNMAQRATDPLIARVHEDFASRYDVAANLASAISRRPTAR